MATPFFQQQNPSFVITAGSPGAVALLSKDASGAAIDIHTGYTVQQILAAPQGDLNVGASGVDLTADMSASFSATGVVLSWTGAQGNTIVTALQTLHSVIFVTLTNDAGTTQSAIALGTLLLNTVGGLVT